MQLFYQPDLPNGILHLTEEESRHAVKVLRLRLGDQINITDGKGSFYQVEIKEAHQKKCSFSILEETKVSPGPIYRHIAIAPTKNIDRLEWFVEKAVELGIDRISPIRCDNSERKVVRQDRLLKKAISAMKQSLKAHVPQIDELMSFDEALNFEVDYRFIAYVDHENTTHLKTLLKSQGNHLILIGPEGDFSDSEIRKASNKGFTKVSLGKSRLRTETAGVASAHLLNL